LKNRALCSCCCRSSKSSRKPTAVSGGQLSARLAAAGGWAGEDLSGAGLSLETKSREAEQATRISYLLDSSSDSDDEGDNATRLLHGAAEKTIFSSTFNVGESYLNVSDVAAWVPLGFDVYAIGVQECLNLPELRLKLLSYLNSQGIGTDENKWNPDDYESEYVMFTRELGSSHRELGFHGFIALTVFVRRSEMAQGHVVVEEYPLAGVATMGRKLPGGVRAPNKGSAGISLRYDDNSIYSTMVLHER